MTRIMLLALLLRATALYAQVEIPGELQIEVFNNFEGDFIKIKVTNVIDEASNLMYTAWTQNGQGEFQVATDCAVDPVCGGEKEESDESFLFRLDHVTGGHNNPDDFAWGLYKISVEFYTTGSRDSIFLDWTDQNYPCCLPSGQEDVYIDYFADTRTFKYSHHHPNSGQTIPIGSVVEYWPWWVTNPSYETEVFMFPPARPREFSLTKGPGDHPLLAWARSLETFDVSYDIFRKVDNYPFTKITTVTDTFYLDPSYEIVSGTRFSYDVSYFVKTVNTALDTEIVDYRQSTPSDTLSVDALLSPEKPIFQQPTSSGFVLLRNYPNPFNPTTTISYSIQESAVVVVSVFDLIGRRIKTFQRSHHSGTFNLVWDGTNEAGAQASSGLYFCKIDVRFSGGQQSHVIDKMLLIR